MNLATSWILRTSTDNSPAIQRAQRKVPLFVRKQEMMRSCKFMAMGCAAASPGNLVSGTAQTACLLRFSKGGGTPASEHPCVP